MESLGDFSMGDSDPYHHDYQHYNHYQYSSLLSPLILQVIQVSNLHAGEQWEEPVAQGEGETDLQVPHPIDA